MCLTFKEQTSKVIFRLVIPFANRLANLRLADWLANLQIDQIGRLVGTSRSNLHGEGKRFLQHTHAQCLLDTSILSPDAH